jgi:SAM-dependent methyltransferase
MPEKGRLLDVGSGLGYFLDQAQKAGWEVTGLEPQRSAALFCRNRFGIKVHTGTVQNNDLSDKLFDVITLWDVWEHVHEPLKFLNSCASLLAPGGLLVIAVPNASGLPALIFKGNWRYVMKTHLNYFTLPYVRRIFSNEGLMIERIYQTIKVQSLLQGFLSWFPFDINTERIIRLGRENSDEEDRPEQKGMESRIGKMDSFNIFLAFIRRVVLNINLFPMPLNSGDLMELYCRKTEKTS